MRILDEPAVRQSLFKESLRFLTRQSGHMHIINQGKIDVTGVADASFAREFGNIVDANLEQISRT
jgi:hypothetical protein